MAKGGGWERDTCKYLSKWIQGTEKPYCFWRGHGSGGNFTKDESVGERFAGDIYHIREEGKFLCSRFVIECKTGYKEASLDKHLKYNLSDPIKSFWEQVCNDSDRTNKYPLLIYKKKGFKTPWVGINKDVFSLLWNYLSCRYVLLYWGLELPETYFFEMNEFFNKITPEIIKENINGI